MQSRIIGTFWVTTILCIVSVLALMGVPAECDAMSITPSRIILNAECVGSLQDIQAIFPFALPTGGKFVEGSFDGYFYFGDYEDGKDPVCITNSFHYCYLDENLLVSFDRGRIQDYAKQNGLEGDVKVTVLCTFNVECNDGPKTYTLEGTDLVEILAPGNKKE